MGQTVNGPATPHPMAQSLRTEFTEIETATRFQPGFQEALMGHEETKVYIQNYVNADSLFFKMFNYDFVHGDANTALKEENAIVLTEETARKFFGSDNAMGEIVNFDNRIDYVVRGVVKEPEKNAHFQFDVFLADNEVRNMWLQYNWYTYFKLRDGVDVDSFKNNMFSNFMKKTEPDLERLLKITMEDFKENKDNTFEFTLQSLHEIHLHSHKDMEIQENGNITYIYVFIGIAILVILIAGINFMNLSTARSGKRAKEVGVRKVTGASRRMLISQFLTESIVQSFIALFLAFIFVELFLPGFNNIMETNLNLVNDHIGQTIAFSLIVTVFYGLFAGSYPAFFLSGFQPVAVLKGDFTKSKGGSFLRKGLVIIQFTASTILIIGMIIIFKQISFLQNKDLGFKGEQVIIVPIQTAKMVEDFNNYREIFLRNSNVQSISRASSYPGRNSGIEAYVLEGREEKFLIREINVDFDFYKTLDIELVEGRVFDREKESDSLSYFIINQAAMIELNIEDPIGKRLGETINNEGEISFGTIIGVVKDFHMEGFNQPIRPTVMTLSSNVAQVSFKIASNDMNATIDFIEEEWNKLEPTHPFRYTFLDQRFGALLRQQENFGNMFLFLTILAIIISAMGLYGLSSYTAEQRTKEIGVRKVLGASVGQIMKMLTTDFMKLVFIANIFAWPLTYILAKDWLSNFSYQIDMPVIPYIFATLLAMIIALLTVSSQAYQAANAEKYTEQTR
jgi:putative ABC transport system permease protein